MISHGLSQTNFSKANGPDGKCAREYERAMNMNREYEIQCSMITRGRIVGIPKSSGEPLHSTNFRPLSIQNYEDRIMEKSISIILQERMWGQRRSSYGYQQATSTLEALKRV